MAQEVENTQQWEGSVTAELPHATADEAWPLVSDFFSVHRWLPFVATCERVTAGDAAGGSVRYCAGPPGEGGEPGMWAKEQLLDVDEGNRCLSYAVTESNMGFGRYVARMRVAPRAHGCTLEWSFESDPVDGWTQMGLLDYLQTSLNTMATRIQETLLKPTTTTRTD